MNKQKIGRKISVVILLLFFSLHNTIFCFLPLEQSPQVGPQAVLKPISEFGKPNEMIDIAPGRPIAARDKYGNRLYFTPNGKLTLRKNTDGTLLFSLTTKTKEYNAKGELMSIMEKQRGSELVAIKNEKGQVLGYQKLGLGGKVLEEFDKDMNLVKTYKYDKYGKKTAMVIDENSQVKTIHDDKGRPIADVNYEGTEVAWYIYDENNILIQKIDIQGNRSYFDNKGKILYTEDQFGNILTKYFYDKDEKGNEILVKTIDYLGNVTHYKDGKPVYETDKNGKVIKEYHYDGNTLVYTFDRNNLTTTWYDIDGKQLFITEEDAKVLEYLYFEGKLVGVWNYTNNTLSVYIHGNDVATLLLSEKPSAEQVAFWIEAGIIKKEYTDAYDLNLFTKFAKIFDKTNSNIFQPRENITYKNVKKNRLAVGYFNEDGDFILVSVVRFNKNGLVERKEDIVSGKVQEFDATGKIKRVYTKLTVYEKDGLKEKIYEAKVIYQKDGSYEIHYKNLFDRDGNPNTFDDIVVLEDAQVENYSFDGRLLNTISKTIIDGEEKISKTDIIYDASGDIVKKQVFSEDGELLYETYFKYGLEQYTVKYHYENHKIVGSFVVSKNFYDKRKLIKTESYNPKDVKHGLIETANIIYYDQYGRPLEIVDNLGRTIEKFFYNDKNKKEIINVTIDNGKTIDKILTLEVQQGGILYSENYYYLQNEHSPQQIIRTYYYNGNQATQAISYLIK